jgi:dUTP pyrophosphatase
MKVNIKRIDKTLPLPKYETKGSVGVDLITRVDTTIKSQKIGLVPANVVVEVPYGYALILASRSSTPSKKGLSTPHGIGIIDHDYCGENDELKIQVYNFTEKSITIKKGNKIAQGLFVRVDKVEFVETEKMDSKNRGGFGNIINCFWVTISASVNPNASSFVWPSA